MRHGRRRPGERREAGSASVLGVQVVAVLALLTLVCCAVAALVAAHRRAQAAADLGALAGATAIQQGAPACPAVVGVVSRNRARVRACDVDGEEVRVSVVVRSPPLLGHVRELVATARAGPVAGLAGPAR